MTNDNININDINVIIILVSNVLCNMKYVYVMNSIINIIMKMCNNVCNNNNNNVVILMKIIIY